MLSRSCFHDDRDGRYPPLPSKDLSFLQLVDKLVAAIAPQTDVTLHELLALPYRAEQQGYSMHVHTDPKTVPTFTVSDTKDRTTS